MRLPIQVTGTMVDLGGQRTEVAFVVVLKKSNLSEITIRYFQLYLVVGTYEECAAMPQIHRWEYNARAVLTYKYLRPKRAKLDAATVLVGCVEPDAASLFTDEDCDIFAI